MRPVTVCQRVDRALWPYLRRRWVYAVALVLFFVVLCVSVLLPPRFTAASDALDIMFMLIIIDSRARYVLWREFYLRRRLP